MEQFIKEVLEKLPSFSEEDRESVVRAITHTFQDGFTVSEAVSFMRCTEEINPELSEKFALERMARIRKSVAERKAKENASA